MGVVVYGVSHNFRMNLLDGFLVGAGLDYAILKMRLDKIPALGLQCFSNPATTGWSGDRVMGNVARLQRTR